MVKIYQGNCLEVMKKLPDKSICCCVTSPPYWGLRDYGTAEWIGGDEKCSHRVGNQVQDNKAPGAIESGMRPGTDASVCVLCGAKRKDDQVGLELTPEEYTQKMVEIFREVRRVLRDDGTVWLNLGDSFSLGTNSRTSFRNDRAELNVCGRKVTSLKPKDLCGIPWRVAFALQADGWYLRSDNIWYKPNPMPESVKDRPTKAHEYIFLLSKSSKYHYDNKAIREPITCFENRPDGCTRNREFGYDSKYDGTGYKADTKYKKKRKDYKVSGWAHGPGSHSTIDHNQGKGNAKTFRGGGKYTRGESFDNSSKKERDSHGNNPNKSGLKNKRSVWNIPNETSTLRWLWDNHPKIYDELIRASSKNSSVWEVSTQGFSDAHFATFPEKLIEPCILAGCPKNGTVLDPFGGAGTTGLVADKLGRDAILIELNPEYVEMQKERIWNDCPLFADIEIING